jgi:hypothetical protein
MTTPGIRFLAVMFPIALGMLMLGGAMKGAIKP